MRSEHVRDANHSAASQESVLRSRSTQLPFSSAHMRCRRRRCRLAAAAAAALPASRRRHSRRRRHRRL